MMSGDGVPSKTEIPLSRGEKALLAGAIVVLLLWTSSIWPPIPSGRENRTKAGAFLREHFPDRGVSPRESDLAPVAVVYDLIRSAEPEIARQSIEFASDQRFGFAAPYVIERLGSGDPELERAAQTFLQTIAGGDYGPGAESWRAWWRDPPPNVDGTAPFGHNTVAIAVPAAFALIGVLLIAGSAMVRRARFLRLGVPLVLMACFMATGLTTFRLVGHPDTCSFGSKHITYYRVGIDVIGLEDARVGGIGLLLLLLAGYLLALVALFACGKLVERRCRDARQKKGSGVDSEK
jgi:hypothetical protein